MKARVTVTLLALGFSALAFAQQGGSAPPFDQVDANHDGMISRSEAAKVEGLDFSKADTNSDGNLSRQEYDAATQQAGGAGGSSGSSGSSQQ
jgi:hypothetical protein